MTDDAQLDRLEAQMRALREELDRVEELVLRLSRERSALPRTA